MRPERRDVAGTLLAFAALLGASPARASGGDLLPDPFALEDAVRFAREHRAEISAARARARAAAQRPAVESALEDPMISTAIDHLPFSLHGADASLAIEQRFPLSGILGHRGAAAEAAAEGLRANADRVSLDVELDAASAFLMLYERRASAAILEAQKTLADQLEAAALARYTTGSGSQADVLRAETEVARFDGALRAIAAEIRAAEVMLNASLGRAPTSQIPKLERARTSSAPPSREEVVAAARASRPELRAGRAEVERARAEIEIMDSMYAPMAMLRTGPAYTMSEGAGWMVMIGLNIPIQRDRLDAGAAEAEAMAAMAAADLVAMRRMIEAGALAERELVIASEERVRALRDHVVPRALRAIDPTLAGYSVGELPLSSVVEAAQTLWSAQMELIAAEMNAGAAWARLRRAIGAPGGKS